jgi:hypothetical protein
MHTAVSFQSVEELSSGRLQVQCGSTFFVDEGGGDLLAATPAGRRWPIPVLSCSTICHAGCAQGGQHEYP